MKGYWNRPDATAEVLQDGWLHTGDLGYFDARGNLFITGRQKEIIVLAQRQEYLSRGDRSALPEVALHQGDCGHGAGGAHRAIPLPNNCMRWSCQILKC